ncbi:MAG: hypothetical protein PHN37_00060 [Candidatus Pacebacteria bacterium]|nr:hypothetical protein [Candidatus Paceibacterota bacterium]
MEQEKEIIEFIEGKTEKEPIKETTEKTKHQKEKDPETAVTFKAEETEQQKEEVSEIENLNFTGKIEKLFKLAEVKGLLYSIEVARKTGDGYLIDVFRDRLAEDNYYKKFLK